MGYTTIQVYQTHDRIIFDVRQFTLSIWKHPLRFELTRHYPTMWGFRVCNDRDKSELDFILTGHHLHCPHCDVHLTSLLLCPKCGKRYNWPEGVVR